MRNYSAAEELHAARRRVGPNYARSVLSRDAESGGSGARFTCRGLKFIDYDEPSEIYLGEDCMGVPVCPAGMPIVVRSSEPMSGGRVDSVQPRFLPLSGPNTSW